jgi:hypothetical protein
VLDGADRPFDNTDLQLILRREGKLTGMRVAQEDLQSSSEGCDLKVAGTREISNVCPVSKSCDIKTVLIIVEFGSIGPGQAHLTSRPYIWPEFTLEYFKTATKI